MSIAADDVQHCSYLKVLHLEGNRLQGFAALASLPRLARLYLGCNRLTSVPQASAQGFTGLRSLDLSFNFVPAEALFGTVSVLPQLPRLRELDASGNELLHLPASIVGFTALQTLNLSFNKLSDKCLLSLAKLPALESLVLVKNALTAATDSRSLGFESFKALQTLDLSCNKIRCVPFCACLPAPSCTLQLIIPA